MTYKNQLLFTLTIIFVLLVSVQSCQMDDLISPNDASLEFDKLSDYNIYSGNPADLHPSNGFQLYEISSELFSDYAQKQRLIKVPDGAKLNTINDDLLEFPEGTIIVKTFFYYNDERDHSLGKKLIETRVLQFKAGKWIAGTYFWNEDQTDAYLTNAGFEKPVNWIDRKGDAKVLSYHIPSNLECRSCHSLNKEVQPIGPKARNLNFIVDRDGNEINQLDFLSTKGVLYPVDHENFGSTPNYNNDRVSTEQRVRAYLDINCAHCHRSQGSANEIRYRFEYETDFHSTKIKEGKDAIKQMMERGYMPKIGTTVIDNEGIELINQYLKKL